MPAHRLTRVTTSRPPAALIGCFSWQLADDVLVLVVADPSGTTISDDAELVALLLAALDAAALDAELGVAARAGRDRERDRAVERRHVTFVPSSASYIADRQVEQDVEPVAAEVGVRRGRCVTMNRSPGSPLGDCWPLPRMRTRLPSFTPAGS